MWLNSTAAPATVIDDEPSMSTRERKEKERKNHEPGDLPEFLENELSAGKGLNK